MPPLLLHDDDDLRDPSSGPDPDPAPTLAEAVTALGRAADQRAAELDALRRLPDDLHEAAAGAGLFRQLVPTALGGLGRSPLDWFRTGMALAGHDASLGWVVTQGAAELGWIGAGADDGWAREVLADPHGTSASSSAGIGTLAVDGATSRFSGRWVFNTGSSHATWIGGMAVVEGEATPEGAPVVRWGWVPAERAEVADDWDPAGLRGTGSRSTSIDAQEIPSVWTFAPEAPTTNDRGPHRILVGNGFWPIATSVAAVQLGNARRALDVAAELVHRKAPSPRFTPLVDSAAVQRSLARAEGLWGAAVAAVERELESMWEQARRTGELTVEQRVRLHRANLTANDLALQVVDLVSEVTGTASVARAHVLSRVQRDAHALRSHITTNGVSAELNTQVALGLLPHHVVV